MTRIQLGGQGDPIPEFALPDAFIDADFPIQTFTLVDGEDFPAEDYVTLGYTNFEAWCVGAAGGTGSDGGPYVGFLSYGEAGVTHYHSPFFEGWHSWNPPRAGWGGAGGGGGMHHVAGLLADLPGLVPVTVGLAGADGDEGWLNTDVPAEPLPPPPYPDATHVYDLPHPTFYPPADGEDGGYSSFGDVCQASGGKGGQKCAVGESRAPNAQRTRTFLGAGGQGGLGDQTTAGGGGAGSTTTSNGSDGTWDGTVGGGGGGGRGGAYVPLEPDLWAELVRLSSSGGQGSVSFADLSVLGSRGQKSSAYGKTVVPGAGGGAKPVPGYKVGSRAADYDPNGAVIVRIAKII